MYDFDTLTDRRGTNAVKWNVEEGDTGRDFLRMKPGCPRSLVTDGLRRLRQGVTAWERTRI